MHKDKCAWGPSGLRAFAQGFTVARSRSLTSVVSQLSHLPAASAWGALPLTPHLSFLSCAGPRGRSIASPGIAVHTRTTAHLGALSHRETESPSRHQEMPFLDSQSERGLRVTSEIRFLLIINFRRRRAGLFSIFPRDSLDLLLRASLAHGVPGRPAGTSQLAAADGNLGRSLHPGDQVAARFEGSYAICPNHL